MTATAKTIETAWSIDGRNDGHSFRQRQINTGTRQVVLTEQDGVYEARLYVNRGETATWQCWKGKTEKGAIRWANKVLGA